MSYRDEALTLLKEHARPEREARHGMIWRFQNGKTVLVSNADKHHSDENDFVWRAVLGDVKRALRDEEDQKMAETPKPQTQTVTAPNYPGNGTGGGQRLGLTVKTKAKKIVLEELASELPIAPHQIKAMLAREGVPVPDDIKPSARDGYLVVSWASTRESVEE